MDRHLYSHLSGNALTPHIGPGVNQIRVSFDHGWCMMGLYTDPNNTNPSPRGARLAMPLCYTEGCLCLSTLPQVSDVRVDPPTGIILLPYNIIEGDSRLR
jgi:hypothetical protein